MNTFPASYPSASLLRRLAAISYDGLLLVSVLFFATLPLILLSGDAIRSGQLGYQLYLLSICFLYYGWQWRRGGQTLGMKAWRLRIVYKNSEDRITWTIAAKRFAAAILSLLPAGFGFLWILFDRQRLAWHDRLTDTRIVLLPRPGRQTQAIT